VYAPSKSLVKLSVKPMAKVMVKVQLKAKRLATAMTTALPAKAWQLAQHRPSFRSQLKLFAIAAIRNRARQQARPESALPLQR
jgi:hypothetical protein